MQQLVLLAVPALVLCCLSTPAGAAASTPPLECSAVEEQPSWPIFHAMNNVTRDPASGKLVMEKLNDANAIGYYKGIYHVMMQVCTLSSPAVATHACASAQQISHLISEMQEGGGNWSHMVSNNLVTWHHIQDALPSGVNMSFPDKGPCDGSMSFPDLGAPPFDGSTPVIIYDADCSTPLPKNQTPPTGPHSPHRVGGDVARLEIARPSDPSDPYLAGWTKTRPGPVAFTGLPCAFPSDIWRSQNGAGN